MKPRPYQQLAIDQTLDSYRNGTNTALIVMPTGCGKTVVFSHILDQMKHGGRVMVLAHREELLYQAADKIGAVSGEHCELEMADKWANEMTMFDKSKVVISSIQTQNAGRMGAGRMQRFDPKEFALLIIDEAHHAVAPSYRRVIDYYRQNENLKVLGVTATPDRTDETALGKVFDKVTFEYGIVDAIEDGWLVPIEQQIIHVESLDFSACRSTAGDLNGKDLAEIMEDEENLHRVVDPTVTIANGRKTLVFTVTVAQAERMCEIFNRHKKGCAKFVTGKTPGDDRRDMLEGFARGDFQFLVNVGVATEGFDVPGIEVVAVARPTKSRALYAQMIGRGTRPLPGIVDAHEVTDDRKQAIAQSSKTTMLALDFVGNSGRHKLVNTGDILGGNYNEKIVARAQQKAKKSGEPVNMVELLEKTEQEERERKRREPVKAKSKFKVSKVNPFDVLDFSPCREQQVGGIKAEPMTDRQSIALQKFGVPDNQVANMSRPDASRLLDRLFSRSQKGLASYRQVKMLKSKGYENADSMTREQAGKIMGELSRNGWRKVG